MTPGSRSNRARAHTVCAGAPSRAPRRPRSAFSLSRASTSASVIVHIAAHRGRNAAFRVFPAVLRDLEADQHAIVFVQRCADDDAVVIGAGLNVAQEIGHLPGGYD